MIVNFSVENWTSFKDRQEVTMYASSERRFKDRCPYVKKYHQSFLPALMLIGGNAAGKSNFLAALAFLKALVLIPLENEERIPVQPYLFQEGEDLSLTSFFIEMLIDDEIYRLDIQLNEREIVYEKLSLENSCSVHLLYERKNGELILGPKYKGDASLEVIARGTRKNRLFLTNSMDQQNESFSMVYHWFKDLVIINPDQIFLLSENMAQDIEDISQRFLPKLDTGIKRIEFRELPEEKIALPSDLLDDIKNTIISDDQLGFVQNADGTEQVMIQYSQGRRIFKKAFSVHNTSDGEYILDLKHESEGTRRVINLLPQLYELMKKKKGVLVIDELDRSLHTQLTQALLEAYLENCGPDKRTQFIFSTHDMMLLNQELLRRDEMWLVERNRYNESELFSISDFAQVRYDTDIRKLYLNGRFGGNPKISSLF